MKGVDKRVFQMLRRVLVFAAAHPELFGKETFAGQRMAEIEAIAEKFSAQAQSQTRGKGLVFLSTDDRNQARRELRTRMEAIGRASKALNLKPFWMPRDRGDRAMVKVARFWAEQAEAVKDDLIAANLSADFIDRLNAVADKLELAISGQESNRGVQMNATRDLETSRREALAILQALDLILANQLQDQQPLLATWQQQRRVGRSSSKRAAAGAEPDPSPPGPEVPIANADTAVA